MRRPGVKIVFSGGDGKMQTLYYVQTDLSDGGVRRSGFLKFCEQLGAADGFIKSASYLLHAESFSVMRDFLLARTTALVQDDFGIPVRFFKTEEWRLQPVRPIPRADQRVSGPISDQAQRRLPKVQSARARFRRGLSLAAPRIQSAARREGAGNSAPRAKKPLVNRGSVRHETGVVASGISARRGCGSFWGWE